MNKKEEIKKYILILSPSTKDDDFLNLEIEELTDRVLIYIKEDEIPNELVRIIAKAYVNYKERLTELKTATNGEIASVSDNGQSVSFQSKNETLNSFYSLNGFFDDLKEILDLYLKRNNGLVVAGEEIEDTKRI